MEILFSLDEGAYAPEKAHEWDAGFDLRTPVEFEMFDKSDAVIIDTGVHIDIPEGYVGFLKSKSGLNVKHGITGEGVIDAGYTGSIVVKLYRDGRDGMAAFRTPKNINDHEMFKRFSVGDKIIQLVILPIPKVELKQVEYSDLIGGERGNNGFGSTGR